MDEEKSQLIKEIIVRELESRKCKILAMEVGDMDHIHVLLECNPNHKISLLVQFMKQYTRYYIWQKYPELRSVYWYKDHWWSDGYYCASVGEVDEEAIKKYIDNQ